MPYNIINYIQVMGHTTFYKQYIYISDTMILNNPTKQQQQTCIRIGFPIYVDTKV